MPLLETARQLQCAADKTTAIAALAELKSNRISDAKVPNQWHGTDHNPEIHAATFDIVIDVILNTIERFPESADLAESILLGWNYCAVHHNGNYFDLSIDNGQIEQKRASKNTPNNWNGFGRLGVSTNGQQRYIPKAFNNTHQSTRTQMVYDWWAIQRNQCLPHPGTGELYYQKTLFGPSKVTSKPENESATYPYTWSDDCSVPYTQDEHRIHDLKLAQEKAQQQRLIEEQALHALTIAKELELETRTRNQQIAEARLHLRLEQQAYEKQQNEIEKQQRVQKAAKLLASNEKREKARTALQQRARAFAARKKLELQAAILESAAMKKAEREYELAQQLQIKPTSVPTITSLALETIIQPPTTAYLPIEQPDHKEDPNNNLSAVNQSIKEPESTNSAPDIVTYVTRASTSPALPEVFITEEPGIAAAVDWTEQTSGKNLQSTPPQSTSTSFPSGSVPPFGQQTPGFKDRKYHGFSGSFALSNRGLDSSSDASSFTSNLGYKPIRSSYFFARTGFTFTDKDSDPFTYYWGIGYNDWHTGTWAFELNHWGPLKPGDGLQLEKAVASLSYKFDSPLLKKNGLSSSFSFSGGESAAPTATLAGSWTPKPNWFVRTLITHPLEGGDTTWAYGFGYSDWRTKTWALEYNNWGKNKAFDLNFRENALVTLSWKWGF